MARTKRDSEPPCVWTDNGEFHETACGYSFSFDTDGVIENGFNYCPYCGLRLKSITADRKGGA